MMIQVKFKIQTSSSEKSAHKLKVVRLADSIQLFCNFPDLVFFFFWKKTLFILGAHQPNVFSFLFHRFAISCHQFILCSIYLFSIIIPFFNHCFSLSYNHDKDKIRIQFSEKSTTDNNDLISFSRIMYTILKRAIDFVQINTR